MLKGLLMNAIIFLGHFLYRMILHGDIGRGAAMKLMKCCLTKKHDQIQIIERIYFVEKIEVNQAAAGACKSFIEAANPLILLPVDQDTVALCDP